MQETFLTVVPCGGLITRPDQRLAWVGRSYLESDINDAKHLTLGQFQAHVQIDGRVSR